MPKEWLMCPECGKVQKLGERKPDGMIEARAGCQVCVWCRKQFTLEKGKSELQRLQEAVKDI
jgi:hypothetical protein